MEIEINGQKIVYETAGDGKPCLLLHGWGADRTAMRPVSDCLVKLGYMTYSPDFPGMGESPEPSEPWTVWDYARLIGAFMDAVGIKGCDLVCHSFGGRVTIAVASEDNAAFGRLVLVDAAGIRPKRGAGYYIKTYWYKLGKNLAKIPAVDRLTGFSEKHKNAGSADYRALKSDIMRKTFVNVVNLDLSDRLEHIENETLLIWGDKDESTPLYMGKLMEKKIGNAGLAVIEGAGHFSYAEKYPVFCEILKAYLG